MCYVFVFTNAVFAASCGSGYDVAVHNIEWDYNIATLTPDSVTATVGSLNANTFILSDDGNCYANYEPYSRSGNDVYPLIEDSDLCQDGYYRSAGTCTPYVQDVCPNGRHNAAVVNSTFVTSEDGNCYAGFDVYSRPGDDIYPMIDTSITVLCPSGQYLASGTTCTSYSQSTCPNNYYSYSLNANTVAQQTNNACPTNYVSYTTMNNCDVNNGVDDTCADIATLIDLTWDDGSGTTSATTCTYNNTITLPTPPTREGYDFVGWKLNTNNE